MFEPRDRSTQVDESTQIYLPHWERAGREEWRIRTGSDGVETELLASHDRQPRPQAPVDDPAPLPADVEHSPSG